MVGGPEDSVLRQRLLPDTWPERVSLVIARATKIFNHLTHPSTLLVGRLHRLSWALFILVLCASGIGLTIYFYQTAIHRFDIGVATTAEALFAGTDISPDGRIIPPEFSDLRAKRFHSGHYWQISEITPAQLMITKENTTSYSAGAWRISLPRAMLERAKTREGTSLFYNSLGPSGEQMRVAVIFSRIDGRAFTFLAGEDLGPVLGETRMFVLVTGLGLLVVASGSLIIIYLKVRVGLRPLSDLTEELLETQTGAKQRLTKAYPVELQPVAAQINASLDHSKNIVERHRMHISDLAHALNTPLSVLSTSAASDSQHLRDTVGQQAEKMRAQVDHHLRRARAAAHSFEAAEQTLVEPVIDELAATLEQLFRHKDVTIDWRMPDNLAFRGESADLLEIAGNLLENACTWCNRKVRIDAQLDKDARTLVLAIEDDGPGLSEGRFDEVLKRGTRLDERDRGEGLGLSLVDELVRAYGGTLTSARGELGGLRVQVRLPGGLLTAT